jgi:hypothetical protein
MMLSNAGSDPHHTLAPVASQSLLKVVVGTVSLNHRLVDSTADHKMKAL